MLVACKVLVIIVIIKIIVYANLVEGISTIWNIGYC